MEFFRERDDDEEEGVEGEEVGRRRRRGRRRRICRGRKSARVWEKDREPWAKK